MRRRRLLLPTLLTPPSGGMVYPAYRLMDGQAGRPGNGPSSPTVYGGNLVVGADIAASQGGYYLAGYWWWVCPTGQGTGPLKFALWQSNGTNTVSGWGLVAAGTITSGVLAAGQWNYVALSAQVPLSQNVPYVLAVGVNGSFPETKTVFGTGGAYPGGIINGPLTGYSSTAADGGTNPAGASLPQMPYSTAGTDPTTAAPVTDDTYANLWLDGQISAAPPAGATSRLWPNYPAPIGASLNSQTNQYTLSVQESYAQACQPQRLWFYSPPGATALPTECEIWDVNTQALVAGSRKTAPAWSGAAGSGWVSSDYTSSGINLAASHPYKPAVGYTGGAQWFVAETGWWSGTGPGANGLTWRNITAPNEAGASPGQGSYASTVNTYPATDGGGENYWVDLETLP